ncbi:MAG: hypothetical protein J2P17_32995 [Mycobacterium sp.]|nr:hypothetical protein [Mycobacterium sp.]
MAETTRLRNVGANAVHLGDGKIVAPDDVIEVPGAAQEAGDAIHVQHAGQVRAYPKARWSLASALTTPAVPVQNDPEKGESE